jgi:hypothetical protein
MTTESKADHSRAREVRGQIWDDTVELGAMAKRPPKSNERPALLQCSTREIGLPFPLA